MIFQKKNWILVWTGGWLVTFSLLLVAQAWLQTWSDYFYDFLFYPYFCFSWKLFLTQKIFLVFATSITGTIVLFSHYYMEMPEIKIFSSFLFFFLIFMLILVCGSTLFMMFIGWEGVGLMSFLLIGWFSSRKAAVFSGKKAVFYNRVGDFFFATLIVYEMMSQTSLLHCLPMKNFFISPLISNMESMGLTKSLIIIASIFCVIVKSAQFFFNPWLTSAMEGPTPVSSLLHSSTMVVAGVFFSLSIFPYLGQTHYFTFPLIILSLITMVLTSLSALSHHDMKKIIALSTASQLGFMIFTIMMGNLDYGFLHMVVHGFFKALLFMSSGLAIHSSNNYQDPRKMQGQQLSSSFVMGFLFMGSIALVGLPFFGAFFSKHSILIWVSHSKWNLICMVGFVCSLLLTFLYSGRLIFLISYNWSNLPSIFQALRWAKVSANSSLSILLVWMLFFGWNLSSYWQFHSPVNQQEWFFFVWIFLAGISLTVLAFKVKTYSHFWFYFGMSSIFNRGIFFHLKKGANLSFKNMEQSLLNTFFQKQPILFFLKKPGLLKPPFFSSFSNFSSSFIFVIVMLGCL
uniref:NADH:ubiquinone reductase (H(+)-translocating) n=1 Tax=Isodiametra pulchra TaxID=504439 RepID=A0A1X9WD99_ISOPU|nr:NADH dehydrogenase subunit 5 [Isodiametra pulchra]ARS00902.1 NADH dehydrogenase subunit 5 [Isodiametra pulchra]